jgi:hypothetical protein
MVEALSMWREGAVKQSILEFVRATTDENSPHYRPPTERVATFDNDGTLWCERPFYIQFQGAFAYLAELAAADPSLRSKPPFKAAYEYDEEWMSTYLSNEKIPELVAMLLQIVAGETQADFEARTEAWLQTAKHSRFNLLLKELTYKPMIQLLDYLRANDFRVFICSGGGMDYVRIVSEELYGISRENVIGSNLKLTWEYRDDGPVLVRQAGIVEPFNDGPGKPVNIQLHVGRPPIMTGGNSNGDLAMMEFAAAGKTPCLNLLVRHDDEKREYAYIASAEKIIETAKERGWTIISMKEDWRQVF